jgi:hypothetical protein
MSDCGCRYQCQHAHPQLSGHGRPPANLVAPVGATYADLDATAGAITWVSTVAGWVAAFGDTGRCDIAALVPPLAGRNARRLILRRVGSVVTLAITMSDTQATPSRVPLVTIPAGFRFGANLYTTLASDTTAATVSRFFRLDDVGGISYGGPTLAGEVDGVLVWDTVQSWPLTRPGPVVRDPGDLIRPGGGR